MALYGAVQGSRPGLKEHSIEATDTGTGTVVVEFGNFMQTVEDVQVSWITPQETTSAFVNATISGTTVTLNVQASSLLAAASTAATFSVSAIGEALR